MTASSWRKRPVKVLLYAVSPLLAAPFHVQAAMPVTVAPVASLSTAPPPDSRITRALPGMAFAGTPARDPLLTALPMTAVQVVTPPVAAPIPQRDKLAELDAQLEMAQNELAGARRQLSEGQKQLQALTGTMRLAMEQAGPDAAGLHPFVRVASRYAGTPYVWGGTSRNGFDCSGFIVRVMRDLGYKALPHSAAEQFNYGTPIARNLLKPGDLVFFANTYKPGISHVGIYIGRNRFIQAASTSKGTIVSDLNDAYYARHYAGARRLAPVK